MINQKLNSAINWQKYLQYFEWDKILTNLIQSIVWIIFFSILFIIIRKIGRGLINHFFKRYRSKYADNFVEKRISTFHSLSLNVFMYSLWFFWIYSILSVIGIPVGTLVASAGIFSLAIGLGAQGFVSDIVSGFFIILEKQAEVGEYVQIGTIKGTVAAVGLRTTQIVSDDGTLNFIPNRSITTISNMSRNNMVAMIQITILPETPIQQALEIIEQVNTKKTPEYPEIVDSPNVLGTVTLPTGKLALQINITAKNGTQGKISHDFLGFYLEALQQADILLPSQNYPNQ
ncbi:small-conductance mechanosensitive channel [Lentilactobacillus senioris DSM 24302 = JCM 17472]|uniref:Small-conductance mechanosensitive channel n=1 Tax=Lentilactobacillus senioris DSM 24302 = JCM 17472 TaxID=1423802 RepID=A0A0R2D255_9LACO|nr:mechanosensitive ion channel family protein [Lentilactobacillus senioris]KRM93699.1 small-conductance mechanosensitive channel [Lentilactobacillus senioris DSM 24302 = JCM 17472]